MAINDCADGRRRVMIRHAELKGITPDMLAWWFAHMEGEMDYAGGRWPRYLVWHPLDHISYEVVRRAPNGGVGPGARLHLCEAFQRAPRNLLDLTVEVERIDAEAAVICHQMFGLRVLRLINLFEPSPRGTRYVSDLTIGTEGLAGRLGFNRLIRSRVLPGDMALAWARHHIEEVGHLEHILPQLLDPAKPPPVAAPLDGVCEGTT
jgi:hypothetical protein